MTAKAVMWLWNVVQSDVAKVTSYVVLYIIWWSLILHRIGGDNKSSDVAMECSGAGTGSDVAMECSGDSNGSDVAKVRVENIICCFI